MRAISVLVLTGRKLALGVRHVGFPSMLDMFIYGASRAERPRDGSAHSFACGTALARLGWAASGTSFYSLVYFYLVSVYFWCPCREFVVMHNSGQSNHLGRYRIGRLETCSAAAWLNLGFGFCNAHCRSITKSCILGCDLRYNGPQLRCLCTWC